MALFLGDINFGIGPDTTRLDNAGRKLSGFTGLLSRLGSVSVLVNGPLGGVAARMSILAGLVNRGNIAIAGFAAGAAAAVYGIINLGQAAIDTAKKMQGLTKAFTAIQGDPVGAQGQINWVHDLAVRTGGDFVQMANSYASFTAAVKGTAIEGDQARKVFEQIAYAAATLNMSVDDTAGTLRAFGQMLSKGTVQAEELRGQLGDRLYGAFQQAAIAMGMSTKTLNAELKKGNIEASSFVVKFAEQYTKSLGIDVTKAIDTVVSSEGRLGTAMFDFSRKADEAVGFSRAYKSGLEDLTNVMNFLTQNMDFIIPRIVAVGGALLGMIAPQIVGGIWAVSGAIVAMTARVIGLNVALLANPFTGILSLIVRLGLAAGGAMLAFNAFTSVFNANTSAMQQQGQQAINAYIKSQEGLKEAVHATSGEFLRQQEIIVDQMAARINQIYAQKGKAEDFVAGWEQAFANANSPMERFFRGWSTADLEIAKRDIQKLTDELAGLGPQFDVAVKGLQTLQDIMKRPEVKSGTTGNDPNSPLNRAGRSARDAQQSIDDLKAKYDNLFKSDSQKQWDEMQRKINDDIQNFNDKLTDAGLKSADITRLTADYAASLHLVSEQALLAERTVTLFEFAQDTIGRALDSWSSKFVSDIFDGKNALESLADTARSVAQDILQTLLQLAVANPFKNALFGMSSPTLGSGPGGSGGWVGAAIQAAMSFFGIAHGGGTIGAITGRGRYAPPGIPSLHSGMRSDEQLVKLQNGERVLARGQSNDKGKAPTTILNILNQSGQDVGAEKGQSHFDGENWIEQIVLRLLRQGKADSAMQRFNLKPGVLRRPFGIGGQQ